MIVQSTIITTDIILRRVSDLRNLEVYGNDVPLVLPVGGANTAVRATDLQPYLARLLMVHIVFPRFGLFKEEFPVTNIVPLSSSHRRIFRSSCQPQTPILLPNQFLRALPPPKWGFSCRELFHRRRLLWIRLFLTTPCILNSSYLIAVPP